MNRGLLDECLRTKRRETFHIPIDEIQRDFDGLMPDCDRQRSHRCLAARGLNTGAGRCLGEAFLKRL